MKAIQGADFYGFLLYPALAAIYEIGHCIWCNGYRAGRVEGFAEHQSVAISSGRDEGKNIALTVAWRLASTDDQKNLIRFAASDLDINLPAVLGGQQGRVTISLGLSMETSSRADYALVSTDTSIVNWTYAPLGSRNDLTD